MARKNRSAFPGVYTMSFSKERPSNILALYSPYGCPKTEIASTVLTPFSSIYGYYSAMGIASRTLILNPALETERVIGHSL
ncbi:MAG: hypothetical protein U9Q79_09290, partial [Candidatus Hydrogenedentes bacterium]|nr:hypothetical protein [Candidatus Hydrogenedentota bacterium]